MIDRHSSSATAVGSDSLSARLATDGYVQLSDLGLRAADLHDVKALLDPLFENFSTMPRELAHDLAETDDTSRPRIQEILHCSAMAPELLETRAFRAVHEAARVLLGRGASLFFDHAIFKPSGPSARTEWHQDSAYTSVGGITIWLPLQSTEIEDGCMRYVPGSNLNGPLPHRSLTTAEGKMVMKLDGGDADPDGAISLPLQAGEACVHLHDTIHGAWPNVGSNVRRAWITQFRDVSWPKRTAFRVKTARTNRAAVRRAV
jgi:hypothetical protein